MQSTATLALADNVRQLMARNEWSQRELAKRAGVSQRAVGYLINYKDAQDRHPTTQTVEAVARAFGLQAWELMKPTGSSRRSTAPAPPAIDASLLAGAIQAAIDAFRSKKRMPDDQQLAAAAAYVYAHVSTGRRMKDAEKAVQKLLEKAGDSAPSFADLH